MGKTIKVVLDGSDMVYYPEQHVSGKVVFETDKELKIKQIELHFKGYANVHWIEESGGSEHHSNSVSYDSEETYADNRMVLYGKEQTREDSVLIKPGVYTYPFTVQIPTGAPCSYEAFIGQVRYMIQATVDMPWARSVRCKTMISVMHHLDLNIMPNVMNKGEHTTAQKHMCCLCCKSDPIVCHVQLERTGYVPGEAITFSADIDNRSSRQMTCSKAKLVMEVTYITPQRSKTMRYVIGKKKHGKIDGCGTDVWIREKLHVPPVPPSYLIGCSIIDIWYYLMMVVDPSCIGFDLEVPVEVVIGSIPIKSIADAHGFSMPTPSALPDVPPRPYSGQPRNLYSDSAMHPPLPKTIFAESAMGRQSTLEAGEKKASGSQDYAPYYTYYNWDKPDPASMFTV